jgi:DNA-directed RNA polymerase alpha subunit
MRDIPEAILSAMTDDDLIAMIASLQRELTKRAYSVEEIERSVSLSNRTINALKKYGHVKFHTVADVLAAGKSELRRIPGLGKIGIKEIEDELAKLGAQLK